MGRFVFEKTKIEGLIVIKPQPFGDERGYFFEAYNVCDFEEAGLGMRFVQTNESMSTKGVLRGLHFQKEFPQGKLVRCTVGEVFDVAVDLRRGSKTFGQWFGLILSESNFFEFYVPKGFAHGFYVLSEKAKFEYMVTDYYHPNDEGSCRYDDPDIAIDWPIKDDLVLLSEKDKSAPFLREIANLNYGG